ncbi:DUF551 domain-containing protein [Klebsiella aerogenes]|uniref:DUF551 domain-containing protein n=1 Tax=Klebsiella aerogenes TaxID=548 RepID=UPI003896D9B6
MTKSTITREWLQQTIAELESVRDEIPFGIDTNSELELAAFKMAMAAMDSEPVAWTDEEELRDANESGSGYLFGIERDANKFADPRRQIMLYRHPQPAPVVHVEVASAIEELKRTLVDCNRYNYCSDAVARVEGACRAAMLQAEPVTTANKLGNSPVIPDTWIPVSERMPEDEQEVLTINRMGHRFVSLFDKHSGLFFDRLDAPSACCIEHVLVTHWMPLPTSPQEAKP